MKALDQLCLICGCRLSPSVLSCLGCCRSLQNSGVTADEVNYVNAHATSTPAGDMAEYRAIRAAIPGSHVRINGTKSMMHSWQLALDSGASQNEVHAAFDKLGCPC